MMRAHEAMARLILIQKLMDYSGIPMRKGKDSPTVVAKKLLFLSGYTVKATVTGSNVAMWHRIHGRAILGLSPWLDSFISVSS